MFSGHTLFSWRSTLECCRSDFLININAFFPRNTTVKFCKLLAVGPAVTCSWFPRFTLGFVQIKCCSTSFPHMYKWNKNAPLWEVKWKLISCVFFKFLSIDISALSVSLIGTTLSDITSILWPQSSQWKWIWRNLGSLLITTVWGFWWNFLSFTF